MQRRFSTILILLACLVFRPVTPANAWFFDDDTLVSIDGTKYTADDFKHWWKFWNDTDSPLPATPDTYVDFLLLSREAERMELANQPEFKRQTRIFIQSRALLMLKDDAVNSQIKITDAAIKLRYEKQYQALWLVQRLEFKDEDTAQAAWQELANGTQTVAELASRAAEQGGPLSSKESWVRPYQIDPGWAAIFQKMTVGEVVDPNEYGKSKTLLVLKEQKAGNEQEELAKFHEQIRGDLWKEQEDALSQKLLFQLRDKYQVKIDEERLAALDLKDYDSGNFTDAPVVTSNIRNVSEKDFMLVVGRLMKSRATLAHDLADDEKSDKLKHSTLNTIIGQSVTNWESLDRHYEEKEPFKWEYEFNYNNRLVMALEQRLFVPEVKVSDDEVKQYYQENIERYTQPTIVKIYIVDETQGPIDQIWADVAVGKNFEREVKKQLGDNAIMHETPANHLDPEVRAVVDKLADGETSQIFKAQGIRVLVHLVERTPERPLPLERVQDSISSILRREKLDKLRSAYLETLKSHSKIELRDRQWKAIQKELGGAS